MLGKDFDMQKDQSESFNVAYQKAYRAERELHDRLIAPFVELAHERYVKHIFCFLPYITLLLSLLDTYILKLTNHTEN